MTVLSLAIILNALQLVGTQLKAHRRALLEACRILGTLTQGNSEKRYCKDHSKRSTELDHQPEVKAAADNSHFISAASASSFRPTGARANIHSLVHISGSFSSLNELTEFLVFGKSRI